MRKFKISLIILLLYIALIFNLDRLKWNTDAGSFGIHTFVYGLVISSVVLTFLIPRLEHFSIIIYDIIWVLAYFFLRLTIFNDTPFFVGTDIYITITEVAILLVSTAISNTSSHYLTEFGQIIENVYIPESGNRVRKIEAAGEDIKTEFIRSRRHQRPLALVVIRPTQSIKKPDFEFKKAVAEIQRHLTGRFIAASLAKIISNEARRTDLIISQSENGPFYVLCPETKGEQSIKLAERIRNTAVEHFGIPVSYGIASFPDEALTYEELVQQAEYDLYKTGKELPGTDPAYIVHEDGQLLQ
jgi:GGDEF domain-containing protein